MQSAAEGRFAGPGAVGYLGALVLLMAVAAFLRFSDLDRPFTFQDAILPAFIACYEPGYWWMISFYSTGGIIQLVAWVSALVLTSFGVAMTEFWWIAPIAAVGTLQVPMTFVLARRLGCRPPAALLAAATMAVLPVHVMQSRLALSHEVLAVFWLSATTLALLHLFDRPSLPRGMWASFCAGVYLASHHYVMPFAVYFPAICSLYGHAQRHSLAESIRGGAAAFLRNGGLLFPLLAVPVVYLSLEYTFVHRQPPPAPDLRPIRFIATLYQCAGAPVATALLLSLAFGLARAGVRSRALLFCVVSAAGYLAPLFLSNASDHHEVSQYAMIGVHFMVLGAAMALDRMASKRRAMLAAVGIAAWVMTLPITLATVFLGWGSPLAVSVPKGGVVRDPGIKAAGYFVRRHVPPDVQILSVHTDYNRYSAAYYLRGGNVDGLYVLNGNRATPTREKLFAAFASEVEIVIASADILRLVEEDGRFEKDFVIECQGEPCVWIFARPGMDIPRGVAEAAEYNDTFDRDYAPRSVPVFGRTGFPVVHDSARRVDELDARTFTGTGS